MHKLPLIILIILLFPNYALPNDQSQGQSHCVKTYENGCVDWTTGQISAMGKASPPENKALVDNPDAVFGAARADASRNLIMLLKGMGLNGETSVGESATASDIILAGIEKTAMDAQMISQHFTSDRALEVCLETTMFGGFLQLVLPEEIGEIPTITQKKIINEKRDTPLYTGIILDARGRDFQPVIYPPILSETGDKIYGTATMGREYAVQQGICTYLCNPDHPLIRERAGSNPMTIKVLRKGGQDHPALIISSAEAKKIENTPEHHAFMKECRVVILMDP